MNTQSEIVSLEDIAEENGIRFWHAHKLSEFLGYKDFESFQSVIRKARVSSEQIGIDTDSEFVLSEYNNGERTYKLTRFALFLCVVHADEKKPTVTQAKAALAKFGLKSGVLYDFMGITELAANTFRVTQTAESIRQNNIISEELMIEAAKNVGSKVRQMVEENTGKSPEALPTEPKLAQIKSKLKLTRKKMLQHDKKKSSNPASLRALRLLAG